MAARIQQSLIHRLLGPALLTAGAVALLGALGQLWLQSGFIRDSLSRQADGLLHSLQEPARRQLLASDQPDWHWLLQHPQLHGLHLSNRADEVLLSERKLLDYQQHHWLADLLLGQIHHQSLTISDGARRLGSLTIELDTAQAGQLLVSRSWIGGLTALLLLLAGGVLQLLITHRLVTRPLAELGQQLMHLDPEHPGQRLLPRPRAHAGDELELWVDRTNHLITCLAHSERMRQVAEQRLTSLGRIDQLTGLPNRSLLLQEFAQLLHDTAHQQGRLAVLCLGLDDFQSVNERYGYDIGDHVLATLASRLRSLPASHGCLGRLGADQFAILQRNLLQPGMAADLASEVLALVSEPFSAGPHSILLKATIGITLYPDDGLEAEGLLQRAEQTLALAKQGSRNRYRFYVASIDQQIRQQRELEQDLRLALQRGELQLYFQPQVNLGSLQVCAAEVLLRWQHPQRGLVMPDQFIPLAERSELISEISDWILEQSCRRLQQWQADGRSVRLAINLSTRQLADQQLPARVRQLLEKYRLPGRCIELEITETGLMDDIDCAARQLYSLRQSGVMLAIDDFGTGYSSLGYLKTLPLDKLKIDRSFVSDLGENAEDASIVLAIIQLARNLNMLVLAEGVENAAQEAYLRQHGCNEAQGYRYGRPMPAADFERYLQTAQLEIPVHSSGQPLH